VARVSDGDRRLGGVPCGKRRVARGGWWQVGQGCQRGERAYLFRIRPGGPWAETRLGPKGFPRPSFNIFCSFLFLFLISGLFHNFCKLDSNQIKPLSKFF
jgi:hypothetical protein